MGIFGKRLGEFKKNIMSNTIGTLKKEFNRVRLGPIGQMIHKAQDVNTFLNKFGMGSGKLDKAFQKVGQIEGQADQMLDKGAKIEKTLRQGSMQDKINMGADALMSSKKVRGFLGIQ